MKTEFMDVNETRKNVRVEIPSTVVDAEIDRIARDYSKKARIPGFRPGKAPARVIKQRYKDQILHDVAHDLIPRAVDDALRERGMEAVDTPDVRDVTIEQGQPLTFTASFDTVPTFDPGELSTIAFRRASKAITDEAVQLALQRLRDRAARHEPVEGRGVDHGDTVVLDLERRDAGGTPDTHHDVSIELGAKANPPGFDEQLLGLEVGATKAFTIHYPADYPIGELATTDVSYTVTVKGIKRRVLPELDDEFAKDLGEFGSLGELRDKIRGQLKAAEEHKIDRDAKNAVLEALVQRAGFEVPDALIERHMMARTENAARGLALQGLDPTKVGVDWEKYRGAQREESVKAAKADILLDEIARREGIEALDGEVDAEIARYAERMKKTKDAVRARMEKDGDLGPLKARIREEKTLDLLKANARMEFE